MKTRSVVAVAGAALSAFALLTASGASASTEIGDTCTGDHADSEKPSITQLVSPSSPLPLAAPTAGVVTKWKVSVISYPGGVTEQLKILRPAAGPPNTFTVVGESTPEPIVGGANVFETRIPIAPGDRLGVVATSATGAISCEESSAPGDVMGYTKSGLPNGTTAPFGELAKARAAVSAVIEPDADGDGYGDDTQDKCPQSAASHEPCPTLILDAVSMPPGKGAVRILVATSNEASITVSASATLRKAKKKARLSAVTKLAPIAQLVTPGKIATYTMNYTGKLKRELAALPKSKTVKLKVKAEGKSLVGAASADFLTVKLKGQKKAAKH